jgi:hypothetical protein
MELRPYNGWLKATPPTNFKYNKAEKTMQANLALAKSSLAPHQGITTIPCLCYLGYFNETYAIFTIPAAETFKPAILNLVCKSFSQEIASLAW